MHAVRACQVYVLLLVFRRYASRSRRCLDSVRLSLSPRGPKRGRMPETTAQTFDGRRDHEKQTPDTRAPPALSAAYVAVCHGRANAGRGASSKLSLLLMTRLTGPDRAWDRRIPYSHQSIRTTALT